MDTKDDHNNQITVPEEPYVSILHILHLQMKLRLKTQKR